MNRETFEKNTTKPRKILSVELPKELLRELDTVVGLRAAKLGERVTRSEIVIECLRDVLPKLKAGLAPEKITTIQDAQGKSHGANLLVRIEKARSNSEPKT